MSSMRIIRIAAAVVGVGLVACGGKVGLRDDAPSEGNGSGGQAFGTGATAGSSASGGRGIGGGPVGGHSTGGAANGGRPGSGGGSSGGGELVGGQVSGGGEFAGGQGSGGGSSGGDGSGGGLGGQLPEVPPDRIGHTERSCGAFMWSLDGATFLNCRPGDEHADHPDCVLIDCTAHGDVESICVFSNHCLCSEGFVCSDGSDVGGECEPRASCIPE